MGGVPKRRRPRASNTQIHYAREQGRITEEMEYVARRERMDAELNRPRQNGPRPHDHPC